MRYLILLALVGIFALVVQESYADSDFTLDATGFSKINGKVEPASLHLSLVISDSGMPVFGNGQISLGNDPHSIDSAGIVLSNNKRLIRLNAETENYSISASGRTVLSAGDNIVYQLNGKTSDGSTFSVFARLKPSPTIPVISEPQPAEKDEILLLVKHTERVQWKSTYKFTVRTLDPKTNPLADFATSSGYLDKVKISAIVTNPLGNIIKTSSGETSKFGYFDDSVIIPDNARTGIYKLAVTASGENYQSTTREFTFVVIPLNTSPT